METPHEDARTGTALNHGPEPWWKSKTGVSDRIGKALLISQPLGDVVRRVVGLYQARASEADPQRVQLKIAATKKDGASFTKTDLSEALDPSKWKIIPHFVGATYELEGDKATVVDTVDAGGNLTGVTAVLQMSGQPAAEPADFQLSTFVDVWVPKEAPPPAGTPAPSEDEAGEEVPDAEVPIPMSVYPKVLAALRAAELMLLEEVDLQRHVAVPWVAAALGE